MSTQDPRPVGGTIRERVVRSLLKAGPTLDGAAAYADTHWSMPRRQIDNNIRQMQQEGFIKRIGECKFELTSFGYERFVNDNTINNKLESMAAPIRKSTPKKKKQPPEGEVKEPKTVYHRVPNAELVFMDLLREHGPFLRNVVLHAGKRGMNQNNVYGAARRLEKAGYLIKMARGEYYIKEDWERQKAEEEARKADAVTKAEPPPRHVDINPLKIEVPEAKTPQEAAQIVRQSFDASADKSRASMDGPIANVNYDELLYEVSIAVEAVDDMLDQLADMSAALVKIRTKIIKANRNET